MPNGSLGATRRLTEVDSHELPEGRSLFLLCKVLFHGYTLVCPQGRL